MTLNICISVWQVQIQEIAVLGSLKDLPNVFGIADDILVVGYDIDSKGHDDTL